MAVAMGADGRRVPSMSAGPRVFKAPRMSHSSTPARVNTSRSQSRASNAQAYNNSSHSMTGNSQVHGNATHMLAGNNISHTNNLAAGTTTGMMNRTATGTTNPTTTGALNTAGGLSTGVAPSTYTYGYGSGARSYRAYGYGNGYRNRRYGAGYGYGRSQGNNRAVVGRLRSVHASLARIDHDYQGHRVRAMHAISMAIRQLSHRSMVYSGTGFSGMNNGRAMGMRQGAQVSAVAAASP